MRPSASRSTSIWWVTTPGCLRSNSPAPPTAPAPDWQVRHVAEAHLADHDLSQALHAAGQATQLAQDSASRRVRKRLNELASQLHPHRHIADVLDQIRNAARGEPVNAALRTETVPGAQELAGRCCDSFRHALRRASSSWKCRTSLWVSSFSSAGVSSSWPGSLPSSRIDPACSFTRPLPATGPGRPSDRPQSCLLPLKLARQLRRDGVSTGLRLARRGAVLRKGAPGRRRIGRFRPLAGRRVAGRVAGCRGSHRIGRFPRL